jgi:hypothetical protein
MIVFEGGSEQGDIIHGYRMQVKRKKAPMDANAIGMIWSERRFSEKPFLAYLAEKDGAGG